MLTYFKRSRRGGLSLRCSQRMAVLSKTLTVVIMLLALHAQAQTFESNNIKYKILDADKAKVAIVGTNLKSGTITLPSSVIYNDKEYIVEEIGDFAFNSLTNLNINGQLPSHLKKIGQSAFGKCSRLGKTLILPTSLEVIGERAFSYAGISGTLILPDSLKRLDEACFIGCKDITTIEFRAKSMPDSGVRQYLFNEIYQNNVIGGGYVKLIIGNNVERIPACMFQSLYQYFLSFEKKSRCTEIGAYSFSYTNPGVCGSIDLPSSIRTIGTSAFKNCSKLTGLTFAEGDDARLISIGDNAFDCTNLTGNLHLPSSVESIGKEAFNNCSKLSGTLVLPDSLKYLGTHAFCNCSGISSIDYKAVAMPDDGVAYDPFSNMVAANNDTLSFRIAKTVERIPKLLCNSLYRYTLSFENGSRCREIGSSSFACSGGKGIVGNLSFPDGLRIIGKKAFENNKELQSVSFSKGLEQIGAKAFSGCMSMKADLNFPVSLTDIGNAAFEQCKAIDSKIVLPASLTNIGKGAFTGCVNIRTIDFNCINLPDFEHDNRIFSAVGDSTSGIVMHIGKDVKCIPGYLMISNPNVNDVDFEEGSICKAIGDYAFSAASDQSKAQGFALHGVLELPVSIRTIGKHAFSNHKKLTSINLHSSIERIGEEAFSGCENVVKLYFGPAECTFEHENDPQSSSFKDMGKATAGLQLTIGREVTKIEPYQFCKTNLSSLTFEKGSVCRDIADEAFNITSLKGDLALPAGLQSLGVKAFYRTSLSSVDIPESISRIGRDAFSQCKQLASVRYNAVEAELFNPETTNQGGVFCMAGISVGGYALSIGSNTRIIPDYLFENGILTESKLEKGGGIRTLSFAENCMLDSIGMAAFTGNALLSGNLDFPASVRSIGTGTFSECKQLQSVNIPSTVRYLGDEVFSGCNGLKKICYDVVDGKGRNVFPVLKEEEKNIGFDLIIGSHVKTIPDNFCTNAAIDSISLHKAQHLQSIGDNAFSDCSKMQGHEALAFSDAIKSIGNSAFNNCKALTGTLNLPVSLEKLGTNSLSGIKVSALVYNSPIVTKYIFEKSGVSLSGALTIGAAITAIPSEMFSNCIITDLTFDSQNKLECIGDNVFCNKLSGIELKLPETVQHIGKSAFAGAGCIGEIHLPSALRSLGSQAFKNCTGLTGTIDFPKNITKIPEEAFAGCKGLTGTLLIPAHIDSLGCDALSGTGFDNLIIEDSDVPLWTGDDFNKTGGWIVKSPSYSKRVTVMDGISTPTGMFANMPLKEAYIGRNLKYLCGAMLDMGVTRYYYSPFNQAKTIETITIGNSVDRLNDYQFSLCTGLKTVVLPDGLKTISKGTFNKDSSLVSIQIPRNVEVIGSSAFNLCASLEKVSVGNSHQTTSVESASTVIEDYAFNACEQLRSIVLSDNVSSIGNYAFRYCSSLAKIYCMNAVPQSISSNAFRFVDTNNCKLYVPTGSSKAYENALVWNEFMIEEDETLGITPVKAYNGAVIVARYDLNGHRLNAPIKGINILKMSDGTVRKVLVE